MSSHAFSHSKINAVSKINTDSVNSNQAYLCELLQYVQFLKTSVFQPRLETGHYHHLSNLIQSTLQVVEKYYLSLPMPPTEESKDYQVIMYMISVLSQIAHHAAHMGKGIEEIAAVETKLKRSCEDAINMSDYFALDGVSQMSDKSMKSIQNLSIQTSHYLKDETQSFEFSAQPYSELTPEQENVFPSLFTQQANFDIGQEIHQFQKLQLTPPYTPKCDSLSTALTQNSIHHSTNTPSGRAKRALFKSRPNHPPKVTEVLRKWFNENINCPYPNDVKKRELANEAGINVDQLNHWFINQRRRSGLKFKKV